MSESTKCKCDWCGRKIKRNSGLVVFAPSRTGQDFCSVGCITKWLAKNVDKLACALRDAQKGCL